MGKRKCNKMTFATIQDAKNHIKDIKMCKGGGCNASKLRPYLCNYCGTYHLTSQSKSEAKIKKREGSV